MSTERPTPAPTASLALNQRLERREEELAFLAEITHALAEANAEAPLFGLILERVAIVLGCESVALVATADDGTGCELLAAMSGGRAGPAAQRSFPRPDALIEAALAEHRAMPLQPGEWVPSSELLTCLLGERPLHNGMAVPFAGPERTPRGVLVALNRPEPFQPDDVRLLIAFADQAAIAVARQAPSTGDGLPAAGRSAPAEVAERFGRTPTLEAAAVQLRVQDALLEGLFTARDEDALIEGALDTLRTSVGAARVELLLNEGGEAVRRYASTEREPDASPAEPEPDAPRRTPALVRETARHAAGSAGYAAGPAEEASPVASVPVRVDDRVLGTLLIAWDDGPSAGEARGARRGAAGTVPASELEALRVLAARLGRALAWARLIRRAALEADALDRRVAERTEALTRTREQLVRSQWLASLGELAAGVAHDLNNALNPIVAFAELIRENHDRPEKVRTYAERILMAAQGGAETVRRIQRFTRRRLGALPLETVTVVTLVEEAIELTRPNWPERTNGGAVRIETSVDPDLEVEGNPGELRQALLNLITNALDAMQGGGTLRFIGQRAGEEVQLAVQDTGDGMPAEVLERALEPFFTTKGVRGTGLGLSEVFGIARRHGGSLELETWEGVGTSVLLRLPVARAETRRRTPRARREAPSRAYRILLVDDNVLSLEATAASLRSAGHTVATAARAEDALRVFQAGRYDLVFSDLGLPDLSGWDLLEQLRGIDPKARLGVITGWSLPESDEELSRRGIELVFIKPVDPDDLLAAI